MGERGPIPKRSEERAGHRAKADQPNRVVVDGAVSAPSVDEDWAPLARAWYESLLTSGQAQYFEPSDWEYARILAQLLSDELLKAKRSSEMVKGVLAGMGNLGTTEADRRRMRIEVERKGSEPDLDAAKVAVLSRYADRAAQRAVQ